MLRDLVMSIVAVLQQLQDDGLMQRRMPQHDEEKVNIACLDASIHLHSWDNGLDDAL